MSSRFFEETFRAVTDYYPMFWQNRLYELLISGKELPRICDLPTGLGKTSVIPIWLIALSHQSGTESITLPRRLLYVVNRRTVVDQATAVTEQIRERLISPANPLWSNHEKILRELGKRLQRLSPQLCSNGPVAVSTLRGELADNEEWKADPTRPAIIIGTIDMIGSRLLFIGYGDGRYLRAHHAGLIGQDSLFIHDEAHLTPAFSSVLREVAGKQSRSDVLRPMRVMELSATSRGEEANVFRLETQDEGDKIVRDRLDARKRLFLHEEGVLNDGICKMIELAKSYAEQQAKILIYVRSPESANQVAKGLRNFINTDAEMRIAVLTGSMRGFERDLLIQGDPVYRAFLDSNSVVRKTVYLVSTSAGEVGVDLDAHHIICDLTTLDSIIQRLGRVNRRGHEGREARVDMVAVSASDKSRSYDSEFARSIDATAAILKEWLNSEGGSIDVSPRAFSAKMKALPHERRTSAFAPKPTVPPLTDPVIDAWSLTSINVAFPGRREVAPYLHGLTDDLPETHVAWRAEVQLLSEAHCDESAMNDWFLDCRIESREKLRDRTDRVKKVLEKLLRAHCAKMPSMDFPVVLLSDRGEASWSALSEIVKNDFQLAYKTIVLPVTAGGLNQYGLLDPSELGEARDVADKPGVRERRIQTFRNGEAAGEVILVPAQKGNPADPVTLEEHHQVMLVHQEECEEQGESKRLLLMVQPARSAAENPENSRFQQPLTEHTGRMILRMKRIVEILGMHEDLKSAFITAAELHDLGKNRPVWQRFACNTDENTPVAKSKRYLHGRSLGGYRHELGALLEAIEGRTVSGRAETDLILHLIAAHHGWARPHFELNACDCTRSTPDNEESMEEVLRRFGRLQQRFGHWGLAWLESLFRCADIAASQDRSPVKKTRDKETP